LAEANPEREKMVQFIKNNSWVVPAVGFAVLIIVGIAFS